jgi:hypothetical protein
MKTDENGSEPGEPRNTQPASPTAGTDQVPNDVGSREEVQPAPPTTPAARRRNDAFWAALATSVAVAAMLWIAYQSNVRDEVTQVQKQIEAQHAELQSLKDKIQGITAGQSQTDVEQSRPSMSEIKGLQNHIVPAAQSRTDVEQSQPSINELQGLLNHVETLRGQAKRQKK